MSTAVKLQIKQFASALLIALLGAVLVFVAQYLFHFSPLVQSIGGLVLVGVAHRIPALGNTEAVLTKMFGPVTASNVITAVAQDIASPAQVVAASVKPKAVAPSVQDTPGASDPS